MCNTNDDVDGHDDGGAGDLSPTSPAKKIIIHSQQRVPKRGPGVAELEKILRQQQDKNTSDHNNNNNNNNNNSLITPFLLSSPSEIEHYLQQPHHQRYYPNNNINNHMKLLGRHVNDEEFVFSSMVNPFVGPTSPLSIPSLEHPSSQRPLRNHTSIGPQEQHKFGSMKRPLSVENHYQLADHHPSQRQRQDKSTGLGFNLNLCKPMPSNSRELNNYLENCNTEVVHGVPEANLVKIIAPNSAQIMIPFQAVQHQFPKFDLIPVQAQRSNGTDNLYKPFYKFFPLNDHTIGDGGSEFNLNKVENVNNQAGKDGIDLNLKLSTS